jgi:Ca-activated chloride channel homolog
MKRSLVFLVLALTAAAAAGADGLIIINNPENPVPGHFPFAPLEVTFHRVSVQVSGRVAVTTVDQEFYNPGSQRLEGTYVFPLPEGAHIDRFTMDIGGTMRDAELLPADRARALYEDIVRKLRDPALLEYAGRGAFKARIFPIEPRSPKRVRITYTELLPGDNGLLTYVYPLSTEKFSSAPLRDVSVKVMIDGTEPLKTVYCPSHDAEVRRDGERKAVVGWEAAGVRPDTDFKVVFSRTASPVGIDVMASREAGEDGYFLLLASAGALDPKAAAMPKDVAFVLDTSGSMAGGKIEQARRALRYFLETLGPDDRFEIVRFSTDVEQLFGSLVPASRGNRDAARSFVDGLRAAGGTDIEDALRAALSARHGTAPYYVVFLTDGLPTVGENREEPLVDLVKSRARGARVFSVGIGTDVNAHLLDRIAGDTRAVSQYVLPGEDLELKVSSLAAKIREPVLSDLSLSFTDPSVRITGTYPASLPDLFNGEMLTVFGRYTGRGKTTVRITGTVNGERREFRAEAFLPDREPSNPFLPRLWAVRRVGWLLDEIRMHGESAELRDEVVKLARRFGIVTPYTAFLVLEDEERRGVPEALRSFQELERDGAARGGAEKRMDSMRKEAASEASRSGRLAVDNAVALGSLKDIRNEAQAASPAELAKPAAPGAGAGGNGYRAQQASNYASQVRVVGGRAFYLNAGVWTDSAAQAGAQKRTVRLRFGSTEYFALLADRPAAASQLSLGNSVDLVVDDTLYVVRGE